jgi:hypothetical protein
LPWIKEKQAENDQNAYLLLECDSGENPSLNTIFYIVPKWWIMMSGEISIGPPSKPGMVAW